MTRDEKLLLLRAFKEHVQGVMSVDTEMELNSAGYDPEFLAVLFDSGWSAARMIRTNESRAKNTYKRKVCK